MVALGEEELPFKRLVEGKVGRAWFPTMGRRPRTEKRFSGELVRAATARHIGWLTILVLLAGCGGAGATPTPAVGVGATQTRTLEPAQRATPTAPTVTPAPSDTPAPTATRTATPVPTATPLRQLVQAGACRMAVPAGFVEEPAGGGYYPAADRSGFASLDWPEADSIDGAARLVRADLGRALTNYRETGASRGAGNARIDFTGEAEGRPGKGTTYLIQFARSICAATLFLVEGSAIPFDASFALMASTMQAVDPPPARPTPTPIPATSTSVPTSGAAQGDYLHGNVARPGNHPPGIVAVRVNQAASDSVVISIGVRATAARCMLHHARRVALQARDERRNGAVLSW